MRSGALIRSLATIRRGGTLWATLLLAGAVSLSGCGATARTGGSQLTATPATTTPIATPAAPAARPLVWTSAQLPSARRATIGLAQSESSAAYACAPATGSATTTVATWTTRDRGAHWQPGTGLTVDAGAAGGNARIAVVGCQIMVDATQADTAVAQVGFLPTEACFPAVDCINYALYLSTDAGRHWAPLSPSPNAGDTHASLATLAALATRQGATYALFRSTPRSASGQAAAFVVSHDDMRSWSPVPGLVGLTITGFWLNPVTGALLVMTSGGGYSDAVAFETSTNDGATWSTLAAPPFPFAVYDIAVQQPFTAQPWRICGGDPTSDILNGAQQNPHMDMLACTSDGGAHWATSHLDAPNDRAGAPNTGANYTLVGIADDGSALLTTPAGLERVVSGGTQAQSLGPAPNGGETVYAVGAGAGALWSGPQGGYADPDPQGRIFTASYA